MLNMYCVGLDIHLDSGDSNERVENVVKGLLVLVCDDIDNIDTVRLENSIALLDRFGEYWQTYQRLPCSKRN